MSLQLYARLTKVNEATRRVTGVIASESLDRSREVFDYEASKPHFEKWSGEFAKATDGKSLGNVRAMHGKVAAGRLTELLFDDVAKMITVEADIVDDNEWEKVTKGCYTGFSIGGKYVRKWTDNEGQKRYEADPHEVSIVDLPCNKDATFTVLKADGAQEESHFDASVTNEAGEADGESGDTSADDANAAKAASTDEDAPEDGDLRMVGEVVEKFTDGAWAALGKIAPVSEDEEELVKGCYSIGHLARLAEDVAQFCNYRKFESWDGNSTKPIPVELKTAAIALYDGLIAIVNEDAEKAKAQIAEKLAAGDGEGQDELRKRYDALDSLEKAAVALATALGMENTDGLFDAIEKVAQENAALRKEHEDLRKRYDALPAATKGALKTVEKAAEVALNDGTEDGTTATASVDASPEEVTKAAFASALRKGVVINQMPR